MKPLFIVLEGLDGSGKSTQISLLSERMVSLGWPHTVTREPSDGVIGSLVRMSLTDNSLTNEARALLFAADRYQHVHDVITPALEMGKHVLCDRYYYSSMAYQADGVGALSRLVDYNQVVMTNHKPDMIFFLDVSPEKCMSRIGARNQETAIYENLARLQEDRERFFCAFDRVEEDVTVIDCENSKEAQVLEILWQHIYAGATTSTKFVPSLRSCTTANRCKK